MVTIFEHTKRYVCIHILHDGTLTGQNRAFLGEIANSFEQTVEFHDVSDCMESIGDVALELSEKWSRGTLFRLFIQDIIPQSKMIYLDCDILITMDIGELWDIPLENHSLAGVLDRPGDKPFRIFSAKAFRCFLMRCDRKSYVNAGVLLMDLDRIRKNYNLIQQGVIWFKLYRHCAELVDQDLINSCFCKDIKIIKSRFNSTLCYGNISNMILHARAHPKPWNGLEGSELERIYWKTYLKTPWGRLSRDEIIDVMLDVVKDSAYTHRRMSRCYKNVFNRLRRDIGRSDILKITLLLVNDIYHRLRRGFAREG